MNEERYTELNEAAQRLQEATNEAALAAIRARAVPQIDPTFDGIHCIECEDDIAPGRRALGYITCIRCQERKER